MIEKQRRRYRCSPLCGCGSAHFQHKRNGWKEEGVCEQKNITNCFTESRTTLGSLSKNDWFYYQRKPGKKVALRISLKRTRNSQIWPTITITIISNRRQAKPSQTHTPTQRRSLSVDITCQRCQTWMDPKHVRHCLVFAADQHDHTSEGSGSYICNHAS